MGVIDFKVHLEHQNKIFNPGDKLKGKVSFRVKEEANVKGLVVECLGKASRGKSDYATVPPAEGYHGLESYHHEEREEIQITYLHKLETQVEIRNWIFGGDEEENDLKPGTHSYDFHFALRAYGICGSFEGELGWIRYQVLATLKSIDGKDMKMGVPFTVSDRFDLGKVRQADRPIDFSDETMLGCCLCPIGPLRIIMSLPKAGYMQGENVWAELHIQNATNRDVPFGEISLIQEISYLEMTEGNIRTKKPVVVEKSRLPGVEKKNSYSWTQDLFHIPPDARPTTSNFCRTVSINWYLKVFLVVDQAEEYNLECTIPIFVGTEHTLRGIKHHFRHELNTSSTSRFSHSTGRRSTKKSIKSFKAKMSAARKSSHALKFGKK